jgi:hypothetical protein
LLQHLQREREVVSLRLADKQMDVFRHNHVPGDPEAVPAPYRFESLFELRAHLWVGETWFAMIASEGYKMQLSSLLIAPQSARHVGSVDSKVAKRL